MVMIIASIYIFTSYVIFDQQLKITEKIHSSSLLTLPLIIQKVQVPTFFPTLKIFSATPPIL